MGSSTVPISAFQEPTRTQIKELKRKGDRITIEDDGVPVAALVSVRDAEYLDELEQERKEDWAAIEAIRANFAGIPEEELMSEALKAIKEGREDQDRELEAALVAIRSIEPSLPSDGLFDIAQVVARRAHDRIRHEREIAEWALAEVARERREGAMRSAEEVVLSLQESSHRQATRK